MIVLNGQTAFAPVHPELNNANTGDETAPEQELLLSEFDQSVSEDAPIEISKNTVPGGHFRPMDEDTDNASDDFEPAGSVITAGDNTWDSFNHYQNSDAVEVTAANTGTHENETIESQTGYIDDEVF